MFKFASEIDYYLDFIQQRNQDIFRAEIESSKLGHQFLSLLNKNDIFHSEKMVELNRLLWCCLLNMSATRSTLTVVICCIWSGFKSLSCWSEISLQRPIFNLRHPDAAFSGSMDPMGHTANISNNLGMFGKKSKSVNCNVSMTLSGWSCWCSTLSFQKLYDVFNFERKWHPSFVIWLWYLACWDLAISSML